MAGKSASTSNSERKNGKANKKRPKKFDVAKRRLLVASK